MTSVSFQCSQDRDKTTQKKRSSFRSFGRRHRRFRTASYWRSARFSSASSERSRSVVGIRESSRRIIRIMPGKCRVPRHRKSTVSTRPGFWRRTGLSSDHQAWIHPGYRFLVPVEVLSSVFRGKFIAGLKRALRRGELCLPGALQSLADDKVFCSFLRTLHQKKWVVYAKPPFDGPQHVLHYLARYTHRVAISNHRLVSFADGKVTFRWKDYAHGNQHRLMTLTADEFLRRFLLHTLPREFVRIRSFGFMAHRRRATLLPACRNLLEANPQEGAPTLETAGFVKRPGWLCPLCRGPMVVIDRFTAQQIFLESLKRKDFVDSS